LLRHKGLLAVWLVCMVPVLLGLLGLVGTVSTSEGFNIEMGYEGFFFGLFLTGLVCFIIEKCDTEIPHK